MNIFNGAYFQKHKQTLMCLGQWPFQSLTQRIVIRFIVIFAIGSILTPKLIRLYQLRNNADGIFECIPMIGLHMVSLLKYSNWIINTKKMKRLLIHMQYDWDHLQFKEDVEIMHELARRGKFITVAYTASMFSILILYLASPSVPMILDMVHPLDEPRGRIYLYQTQYFVDQDEYYFQILLHAYMTVPVSVSVIVFVDCIFAAYVHHVCGMLTALRWHLENLHVIHDDAVSDEVRSQLIREKIIMCAVRHKNIVEFANELESSGALAYLAIMTINLFMMTMTGIVTVMKLDQPNEAIKFLAFTLGEVFHIFFSNFLGQELIEHSEKLFISAYQSEWYTFPPKLQRLLLPIMMKSTKPCQVTAGSMYVISMDTFSILVKNAMSFFTVLSSMR